MLFKDVQMRTRRPCGIDVQSLWRYITFLVLNRTLLNSTNALLALTRRYMECVYYVDENRIVWGLNSFMRNLR